MNQTGDITDIGLLGKVAHLVDPERKTIVNTTQPDHWLHPGNVHRSIVQDGNNLYVETRGYGTGIFPWLNEQLPPTFWKYFVDSHIRDRVSPLSTFEGLMPPGTDTFGRWRGADPNAKAPPAPPPQAPQYSTFEGFLPPGMDSFGRYR